MTRFIQAALAGIRGVGSAGPRTRRQAPLIEYVTAAGVVFAVAMPKAADERRVEPPEVPTAIEAPAGHRPFLVVRAFGTQNYVCLPPASGEGLTWTFFGPQATVFDDEARQVLTHYLSPNPGENGTARATWQHSRDTSAVWARAVASSIDPGFVAQGAIPWLLLQVVGAQQGPTGTGKLAAATYIQRVHTEGGSAPPTACPSIGARTFVPYAADYVFYEGWPRGSRDPD